MSLRKLLAILLSSAFLTGTSMMPAVVAASEENAFSEATVYASDTISVYAVDITCGAFNFVYTPAFQGNYNPDTCRYDDATEARWTVGDKENVVTVANRSNVAVWVNVTYESAASDGVSFKLLDENGEAFVKKAVKLDGMTDASDTPDSVTATGKVRGTPGESYVTDGKTQTKIGSITVTITPEIANPILHFDFNSVTEGVTTASDGVTTAVLNRADVQEGYEGMAARLHTAETSSALMAPGTVASRIEGKSGFSVSMWVMSNATIGRGYRLTSLYGNDNNAFLYVTYWGDHIVVEFNTINSFGQTKLYTATFDYELDTRMPAWGTDSTTAGVWQHVTVSRDFASRTVRLFINGNEITRASLTCEAQPTTGIGHDYPNGVFPAMMIDPTVGDTIGGDPSGLRYSLNGMIDEYMLFDRALTASEARSLYLTYSQSNAPSVSEDQEQLELLLEKLGNGAALMAESSNLVYHNRVIKADVNDYTVNNTVIDGELMLTSNLCERLFGTVDGDTLTVNGKRVAGKTEAGRLYFSAAAVCEALGFSYIDTVSENGMFIMLAPDSSLYADDDAQLIERIRDFCIVGEDEPTINVEQTRVVIATTDTSNGEYTYSPSITKLGDVLYATRSVNDMSTEVFKSSDGGATWTPTGAKIDTLHWATIFAHNGALYLIGSYGSAGIGITESTDGGVTWTTMNTSQGVINTFDGNDPHCAPTPVLELNGRLYRAFEKTGDTAGLYYISASADADLLDAASWTVSAPYVGEVNPGDNEGWINESNAVAGPDTDGDGKQDLWILSRSNYTEQAALFQTVDGEIVPYQGSEADSRVYFPSTASKFTCRYDEATDCYIAITCPLIDENSIFQRNYSALAVSKDLITWELKEILLCDREIFSDELSSAQHAFQYVDWIFDGEDILLVVRESVEEAKNFHDSNTLTFYRISNYAELVK